MALLFHPIMQSGVPPGGGVHVLVFWYLRILPGPQVPPPGLDPNLVLPVLAEGSHLRTYCPAVIHGRPRVGERRPLVV